MAHLLPRHSLEKSSRLCNENERNDEIGEKVQNLSRLN